MWTTTLRSSSNAINKRNHFRELIAYRHFHDYFVTHLPSSSLHPDSRSAALHHKLPRDKSTPHEPKGLDRPAAASPMVGVSRELTVVRIPLRSAKHHFGASFSRGQRPYNEDTFQAGTIELPAFAKRQPVSLSRNPHSQSDVASNAASSTTGDPQVFYFGVFDGHGGSECSDFLRDQLHSYIEDSAKQFQLPSSLRGRTGVASKSENNTVGMTQSETKLVKAWKELVGGYFRRFKPEFFTTASGGRGRPLLAEELRGRELVSSKSSAQTCTGDAGIENVLEYAFLKADYDFVAAQVSKEENAKNIDRAINMDDILDRPSQLSNRIGGPKRFMGGSTCSIALISTPTPMPFWHPASPSTLVTSHLGDTRILLCDTARGTAIPATAIHHPDNPIEAQRMRRYATTFVTDSFGEERVQGLANTRAFGDMASKRIGVSAEPEIRRIELVAAQYSFLVMVSDGVCGHLSDQEIVDVVKEARTPEQGAKDLISYATEVTTEGDNATALVIRLGGWERRAEGGGGSLGTKEMREFRRRESLDPRSRQR